MNAMTRFFKQLFGMEWEDPKPNFVPPEPEITIEDCKLLLRNWYKTIEDHPIVEEKRNEIIKMFKRNLPYKFNVVIEDQLYQFKYSGGDIPTKEITYSSDYFHGTPPDNSLSEQQNKIILRYLLIDREYKISRHKFLNVYEIVKAFFVFFGKYRGGGTLKYFMDDKLFLISAERYYVGGGGLTNCSIEIDENPLTIKGESHGD